MDLTPQESSSCTLRISYFIPEKTDCATITIPNCTKEDVDALKAALIRKNGNLEQDTAIIHVGGIPLQRRYVCTYTVSANKSVFVPVNEWI